MTHICSSVIREISLKEDDPIDYADDGGESWQPGSHG